MVHPRVERKWLAVDFIDKRLAIHGHAHSAEVISGCILRGEHDGRHRPRSRVQSSLTGPGQAASMHNPTRMRAS
jgi:hypothetical protein